MLDSKVAALLNNQVNKEFYSAYLYLDIANYYIDEGLEGFGNWYTIQTQEERDHALLFMEYLQNNGEKVVLETIEAPGAKFENYKQPLEVSAKHERYVTSLINDIYAAAAEVKDFRTMQFLDWFIKEQGEEEKNADDMVRRFELFGGEAKNLYSIDNDLGARTYSAPSLVL